MSRRVLHASIFAMTTLGCAPAITAPAAGDGVTVTGHLGLEARRLMGAGPWTAADIDEVVATVYKGSTRLVAVPVGKAHLAEAIAIGNLQRNTAYTVVLTATADGQPIDDADAAPATCTTSFTTTTAATQDVGPFKLKLRDKSTATAANTTGSAIQVTPGGLVPGGGAEATEAGSLPCTTAPVAATLLAGSPTDATLVAYKNTSSNVRYVDTQAAATITGVKFTGTPTTECLRFGATGAEHFAAFSVYPYTPFQPGDKIGTGTFPVGDQPQTVTINPANGDVWVANFIGNSLTRMTKGGTLIATYTGFYRPGAMAFAGDGTFWVISTNTPNSSLYRVDPTDGGIEQTISVGTNAGGLSFDSDGDIWVSSFSSIEVQQVKRNGTKASYQVPNNATNGKPLDMTVDADDVAWVVTSAGKLLSVSQTGTWGTPITVGMWPVAVKADANGVLWVANNGDSFSSPQNVGSLSRVVPGATPAVTSVSLGAKFPNDVAIDSKGFVWVACNGVGTGGPSSGKNVVRIDAAGVVKNYYLAGLTTSMPYGIAIDAGTVWTANSDSNDASGFYE